MGDGTSRTPSQKASRLRRLDIMEKETAATKESAAELQSTSYKSPATTGGRWYNIFPALNWLRAYKPNWLRADLIAGVTFAACLMPAGLVDWSRADLSSVVLL